MCGVRVCIPGGASSSRTSNFCLPTLAWSCLWTSCPPLTTAFRTISRRKSHPQGPLSTRNFFYKWAYHAMLFNKAKSPGTCTVSLSVSPMYCFAFLAFLPLWLFVFLLSCGSALFLIKTGHENIPTILRPQTPSKHLLSTAVTAFPAVASPGGPLNLITKPSRGEVAKFPRK